MYNSRLISKKKKDIKKTRDMWWEKKKFIEAKDENSNLLRERDYILQGYKKVYISQPN